MKLARFGLLCSFVSIIIIAGAITGFHGWLSGLFSADVVEEATRLRLMKGHSKLMGLVHLGLFVQVVSLVLLSKPL